MKLKTCEGCFTERCIISHNSITKARRCPCIECLVKVTCSNNCSSFDILILDLYPQIEVWRNNYKQIRITQVIFPSAKCEHESNFLIKEGVFKLGSKITILNSDNENNTVIYRPAYNSLNNVYFDYDQVIYINN